MPPNLATNPHRAYKLLPQFIVSIRFCVQWSMQLQIFTLLSKSLSRSSFEAAMAAAAPPQYTVVGLRNIGNTCYLNSTLQVISTCLRLPFASSGHQPRMHLRSCAVRRCQSQPCSSASPRRRVTIFMPSRFNFPVVAFTEVSISPTMAPTQCSTPPTGPGKLIALPHLSGGSGNGSELQT